MAWVSYFGPANWTITDGPGSWNGNELIISATNSVGLSPAGGKLAIRAERWRATIRSTQSGGTGISFSQDGFSIWDNGFSAVSGTITEEFILSGHLEGFDEMRVGSGSITFDLVDLEYDDQSVRADSDVLSKYLFDAESVSGVSWDTTKLGFVINDGTAHRLNFWTVFDWHLKWWDDWQLPPNRVRVKVEAAAPVTCWLRIRSGFGGGLGDPEETVVWEKMDLQAGVNEFTFAANDVRYPWERLNFADAGDFPVGSISTPEVALLELHAERVTIPPDPVALLSEITPVNRFTLTLEDGLQSVTLPMTSFNARLVSGRPSFVQAVVPNAPAYIDQITPLSNGEFFVTWLLVNPATGAVIRSEEIARANLATISQAQGPRSSSVTLSGNMQVTYTSPAAHQIDAVHQTNGDQTRIGFSADIKPKDTLNGAEIDAIQITATATSVYMTATTL